MKRNGFTRRGFLAGPASLLAASALTPACATLGGRRCAADRVTLGKTGITLRIPQELDQCGLATPENVDEIVAWVRQARGLS